MATPPVPTPRSSVSADQARNAATRGKVRAMPYTEIGRSGLRRFSGYVNEEFIYNLRGKRGIRTYREMRENDPIVGASLLAIEQTIRKVRWTVVPPKIDDGQLAKKSADFVRTCTTDMSHTWDAMMAEIVTMLAFGWSWMEMVLKVRGGETRNPKTNSRFDDGLVGFRKISLRMHSSLERWDFDDEGDTVGFFQQAHPDFLTRYIPRQRSLLFRLKPEGNNPEGRSLLRTAYRPWFIKKSIEEIEAIGVERDLIGLPVITGPDGFDIDADENAKVKGAIQRLLRNLRRDEQDGIYLPYGWVLKLLSSEGNTRRQFDTDKIITRYDKRIALSVLTHAILLGSDRVGSFALSKSHTDDFFKVAVQSYLQSIAATFNKEAIPYLFRYNPSFAGLGGKYPIMVPGRISAPPLKELGAFIKDVGGIGYMVGSSDIEEELVRVSELEEADVDGHVKVLDRSQDRRRTPKTPEEIRAQRAQRTSERQKRQRRKQAAGA